MEIKNSSKPIQEKPLVINPEQHSFFEFSKLKEAEGRPDHFLSYPESCFIQPHALLGTYELNSRNNASDTSILPFQGMLLEKKEEKETKHGRKKNELYKCKKCEKTYLSYPALYTHNKLKHSQTEETPTCISGRIRGRPRKIIVTPRLIMSLDCRWNKKGRSYYSCLFSV